MTFVTKNEIVAKRLQRKYNKRKKELRKMRENRYLEYKENANSNTFMKTISAYANYGTGKIIFGITDDEEVVGIENPEDACLNLENKINDSMKPVPQYLLEIGNDSTITLTVYEGPYKPYLYKGKAYKRSNSATIEVERIEYNRLVLEGMNQSFEELSTGKQDLTFKHLEDELKNTMHIEKLNMDILKTLELYSDKTGFNNAGALLADQNTFKGIDSVRFGSNIDEIMDRETYENISILEQFSKIMQMFQKYYQYEKIEGKERKLVDKIPEKAFREAIANALVHRAWDVNASIKVSMYENRIEISSPGGLPSELSEEEYLNGQISILRNPIIGNVFFRLKYIEKFGTGILRINYAYEESIKKPTYKVFDNSIMINLPVFETKGKLTKTEQRLVQLLEENDEMSRKQIETEMQLGKATAIRLLNDLAKRNIICKKGAGRAVKYTTIGK